MFKSLSSLVFGSFTALSALLAAGGAQAAGFLMIPDSLNDRVILVDSFDGSLVDDNFINGLGLFQTPLNAIQVNNEIWVSDQLADSIFRFNNGGTLLGTISGGLDNIRGMAFINDLIYVTNAGTNNGAPGSGIVVFDTSGNNVDFFTVGALGDGSPYDVFLYEGELLISDVRNENIERHDLDGNFLGTFQDSDGVTGIDFPQQLGARSNTNVLGAGFSNPAGIYEYDSSGTQLNVFNSAQGVANRGIRGVYELGNGNILWTGGDGLVSTNLTSGLPDFGTFTDIYTRNTLPFDVSTRFIDPLDVTIPESSTVVGILAIGLFGVGSLVKQVLLPKNR